MDLTQLLHILPADPVVDASVADEVAQVAQHLGGISLLAGLFRWHTAEVAAQWTETVEGFVGLKGEAQCFASDWLGRQVVVDQGRVESGRPLVSIVEVGTGEVLETPCDLVEFHESELVAEHDAALASGFYEQWRASSGDIRPLEANECVGYRVPLFLGGSDTVDNLERTDADVYWHLTLQLLRQAQES